MAEVKAGENTGSGDAPEADSEATPTRSRASIGTKRKRSEPRDPNAPKRPCSAYIYFSTEMRPKFREEQPELSMSERSKSIGKAWASLEEDKKKRYMEMAEADKQRYINEYLAYQETDTYKEFIRNKHPGLKKGKANKETSATPSTSKVSEKAPQKAPLSCQQQYIPGSNIPIFSDEFLQHNRDLESQLRKLRQSSANLEEENALLSRHVENMKTAVEKVQNEVKRQEEKNENLKTHLSMLREVLATTFKDVSIPGTQEVPTSSNIDSYMSKLQAAISNEPTKHPLLVEKVTSIGKHLERVLKDRLSLVTGKSSSSEVGDGSEVVADGDDDDDGDEGEGEEGVANEEMEDGGDTVAEANT